MSGSAPTPLGIFGGTFDPIHYGHLRPALELREQLALGEVRFIPAAIPPHRGEPGASPQQRLAMLHLALDGIEGMSIDERELRREGPSYMVDTLRSLRDEVGARPLVLLLGFDAFLGLAAWHEWHSIIALAHLAIATRPGWERAQLQQQPELAQLWHERGSDDVTPLQQTPAGHMVMVEVTPLAISATAIRTQLRQGRTARFLLPDGVLDYIERNRLYLSD
ncbi:MAG TPA: nicotinate-nucleotide adenylyltransferase [Gammaproteobacteria bacterium]